MRTKTNRQGRLYGRIMKSLALAGCASLLGAAGLQAQTYQYGYGLSYESEQAGYHPIEVTQDGGTIMVGTKVNSSGTRNLYLIKLSAAGAVVWGRAFGSVTPPNVQNTEGFDVMEMKDINGNATGYVAVGSIADQGSTTRDVYMVSVSTTGAFQWEYRYGDSHLDEVGHAIVRDNVRLLVAGTRRDPLTAGSADAIMLKTDLVGATPVIYPAGAPNVDDGAFDITMISGGTAILAGFTMNGTSTDGLLFGMDPLSGGLTGIPRRYGSNSNNDTLYSVTALGTRLLAAGTVGYNATLKDMWGLVVETATLNIVWSNTYSVFVSGSNYSRINLGADLRAIGSSTYALVGTTASSVDAPPTTFTRYVALATLATATGAPAANAKVYGGSTASGKFAHGYGVREVGSGRYLIGGMENFMPVTGTTGGMFDYYLIRTTSTLVSNCNELNPTISYNLYTNNAYTDLVTPTPYITYSAQNQMRIQTPSSRELCACPLCTGKTLFEQTPAPSGDLSLEVHGNSATGDLHLVAAGLQAGTAIDIFDAAGRTVRSFEMASGKGEIVWDGTGDGGDRLPNGLYFVRAQGATSVITRPAQLVR